MFNIQNLGIRIILYSTILAFFVQSYYYPVIDFNFGLNYIGHKNFEVYQLLSYAFLHNDMIHLVVNLIMLVLFGVRLENKIGTKLFLIFNAVTAIIAGLFQCVFILFRVYTELGVLFIDKIIYSTDFNKLNFLAEHGSQTLALVETVTIGSSGCVFGVMIAYAFLFPKEKISILSEFSISIRFIIGIYMLLELYNGLFSNSSNIAHAAHLGGAFAGFLFVQIYKYIQQK
jgi:membrane associated rhomboid family serine protease